MLMAALGDVHGNWPAFQAVLAAIDDEGIQTIVNVGDSVVGHCWPNEVVACLHDRAIPTAQGDMDRSVARFPRKMDSFRRRLAPDVFHAVQWAYDHMSSENVEFLRALPKRLVLTVEGIGITVCHGAPASPLEALEADADLVRFQRQRELANTPIIVCGRTHRAYVRTVEDTLFVNPGAVGTAQPRYAVINTESTPWSAEIRHVHYDADY